MSTIPSIVPLLPPAATPLGVGTVAAAAPVALTPFDGGELPLPLPLPHAAAPAAPAEPGPEGLAMRPDQVFLARQLHFQAADGRTLAASWQAMVRQYGKQVTDRELRAHMGQLPPAVLAANQEGRVLRQADHPLLLQDAWRFTVHAGGPKDQHLGVVQEQPDGPGGRRRNARAALRLELELDDGTIVVLQVEPMPGGLALELCAPGAAALERLRTLQPVLADAVERAGLQVLRWRYRDRLPLAPAHARMPSHDVVQVLTLPVFRAVAELALVLPRSHAAESGAEPQSQPA
ncbi:hypothetical protein [Massilia sp. BSC265]|uniref:hypothetical protein n=1 Tax=Massilia sp. BSC265 TaxID=1549812 RepID=UPI00068BE1B0|nr:hypothetical protein [Massilia sp. BSC265]